MAKLLLACCLLALVNTAFAFPDLIGQIVSTSDYKSLAIFKKGEQVFARRIGEIVDGYWIVSIEYRRIYLQNAEGKKHQLMVGDKAEPEAVPVFKRSVPGLEVTGDRIIMTPQFRNYIAEENLLQIMFQAASEPIYDDDFETIGYQVFEIEPGSIYELVGLKNFDIITHIDGVRLSSPWTAISMLKSVKNKGEFTFTYLRNGFKTTVDVSVTY